MEYSYIVWDFNGTLLNDVKIGIESINCLLSRRNLPTLENVEAYRKVFGFPIIDYYRRVGLPVEEEGYPALAIEWVEEYKSRHPELQEGALELLTRFRDAGIPQVLLSATERNMLLGQLEDFGIREFFEEVLGLDNIHAESKLEIARNWRKTHCKANLLYIGDTEHDLQTATVLGADCILVANGHENKESLLRYGVPVVDSLRDILPVLTGEF